MKPFPFFLRFFLSSRLYGDIVMTIIDKEEREQRCEEDDVVVPSVRFDRLGRSVDQC